MSAALDLDIHEPASARPTLRVIEGGGAARPKKGIPASWSRPPKAERKSLPPIAVRPIAVRRPWPALKAAIAYAKRNGLPVAWITVPAPAHAPTIAPDARFTDLDDNAGSVPCGFWKCENPRCVSALAKNEKDAHQRACGVQRMRRLSATVANTAGAWIDGSAMVLPWNCSPSESRALQGEDVSKPRAVRPMSAELEDLALDRIVERVKRGRLPDADAFIVRGDLLSESWIELVYPTVDVAAGEAALLANGDARRLADKALERGYRRIRPDLKKA